MRPAVFHCKQWIGRGMNRGGLQQWMWQEKIQYDYVIYEHGAKPRNRISTSETPMQIPPSTKGGVQKLALKYQVLGRQLVIGYVRRPGTPGVDSPR